MKLRNSFFCISIILYCVFCSITVPVFNELSEANLVQHAENIHTLENSSVHTEDIFAALEIQPVKVIAATEKRISTLILWLCSAVAAKIFCSFHIFSFVQKKTVLSKNKYLKSVIYLQTLL